MSKKSRDIELFIVDIFVALEKIRHYCMEFENADTFRHSSLHWDATIRQLEIIGESLNHLLGDMQFMQYAPDYFRKIVNFRNVIVHEYFGIDAEEVWDVVQKKLLLLEDDMRVIIEKIDITAAVESVQNETDDPVVLDMLKTLVE